MPILNILGDFLLNNLAHAGDTWKITHTKNGERIDKNIK